MLEARRQLEGRTPLLRGAGGMLAQIQHSQVVSNFKLTNTLHGGRPGIAMLATPG
jgi:hypothetical protein